MNERREIRGHRIARQFHKRNDKRRRSRMSGRGNSQMGRYRAASGIANQIVRHGVIINVFHFHSTSRRESMTRGIKVKNIDHVVRTLLHPRCESNHAGGKKKKKKKKKKKTKRDRSTEKRKFGNR